MSYEISAKTREEEWERFCATRRNFVIVGNTPILQEKGDTRSTWEWMNSALSMRSQAYEECIRGYMAEDRLQFYTGGNDYSVAVGVTPDILEAAVTKYGKEFGCAPKVIGNGCRPAVTNTVWRPILRYVDGEWCL